MSDYIQRGLGSVAKPIDTSDEALHNNCAMSGSEQTPNKQLEKSSAGITAELYTASSRRYIDSIQFITKTQRLKAVILKGQQHRSVF